MNKILLALVCVCLFACGEEEKELSKPGAEGPILINVWDLETGQITEVEAASLDVVGKSFDELILHEPKMRMPLAKGHIYISTDEAFLDQGKVEEFIIDRLVHLHGEVDGKPLKGTAQGLEFLNNGKMCKLKSADFTWGIKRVTVGTLQLESGSVLKGDNWTESPIITSD